MIDHVTLSPTSLHEGSGSANKQILHMVKNERMGGYVPSWESEEAGPQDRIVQVLGEAQNALEGGHSRQNTSSFKAALAYQQAQDTALPAREKAFGFGDIVDMVNPLQHIPLVNHAYRAMTGDDIRPISQIIGGALYGGVAGAGVSLVNTIVQEETGKSMVSNTYGMIARGERPQFKPHYNADNPQETLRHAGQIAGQEEDLPAALLAFTPTAYKSPAQSRTAYAHNIQTRYNS